MFLYGNHTAQLICEEEKKHYPQDTNEWLTRKEAAAYLKVSVGTLAVWDCTQRYDLQPQKFGVKLIRYRKSVLDQFIMGRLKVKKRNKTPK